LARRRRRLVEMHEEEINQVFDELLNEHFQIDVRRNKKHRTSAEQKWIKLRTYGKNTGITSKGPKQQNELSKEIAPSLKKNKKKSPKKEQKTFDDVF